MTIRPIRAAALEAVPHGFLGREGGVSTGIYAGLNVGLGSNDDASHVIENRARAAAAVRPGAALVTLHQVHSAEAVTVTAPFADDARPHADALVADRPGLLLGILTADCVPVLFAEPQVRVIGACHAGWKGALAGILDATLAQLEAMGGDRRRIVCAIGPAIRQPSYEVGPGFPQPFLAADPGNSRFFAAGARPGHWQFDLPGFVAARLRQAGVGTVDDLGDDTRAQKEDFFSYRRATLLGEPDYGRQLSAIALTA